MFIPGRATRKRRAAMANWPRPAGIYTILQDTKRSKTAFAVSVQDEKRPRRAPNKKKPSPTAAERRASASMGFPEMAGRRKDSAPRRDIIRRWKTAYLGLEPSTKDANSPPGGAFPSIRHRNPSWKNGVDAPEITLAARRTPPSAAAGTPSVAARWCFPPRIRPRHRP